MALNSLPPTATPDSMIAAEDGVSIELNVLANDTDPDVGDTKTLVSVDTTGLQGAVSWRPDGLVTYNTAGAFQELGVGQSATTSFAYTMQDSSGLTSTARVTVTVEGYNDAPQAQDDYVEVDEKATATIDVLANDIDVDGNDTKTLVSVSSAQSGSTVSIVDNKIVYTANSSDFDPLENGDAALDSLTYVMRDSQGVTSTATVTIGVIGKSAGGGAVGGSGLDLKGTNKPDALCGGVFDDVIDGGNSDDTICGDAGGDWLYGNNGSDILYGGRGFDRLFGENGNDTLFGEEGDDRLDGGNGNDRLLGGAGVDVLEGKNGNDYLDGGAGDDLLEGGLGNDRFVFKGAFGYDIVSDFDVKNDVIEVDRSVVANFNALKALAYFEGGDTFIQLGGNTIVLSGVSLSSLKADDFLFT